MLDGIRETKIAAISLKGILNKSEEEKMLMKALKYIADNSKIEKIIVFTTGILDDKLNELFEYIMKKGIEYYVPNNSMRIRNQILNKKY